MNARRIAANDFWSHVDRSGGPDTCWPWDAVARDGGTYQLEIAGRCGHAPRFAWELVHGQLPEFATIRHRHGCSRACCNPAHLHVAEHAQGHIYRCETPRARDTSAEHESERVAVLDCYVIAEQLEARGFDGAETFRQAARALVPWAPGEQELVRRRIETRDVSALDAIGQITIAAHRRTGFPPRLLHRLCALDTQAREPDRTDGEITNKWRQRLYQRARRGGLLLCAECGLTSPADETDTRCACGGRLEAFKRRRHLGPDSERRAEG